MKRYRIFLPLTLIVFTGLLTAKSRRAYKASQARQFNYMLKVQEAAGNSKMCHECNCESNDPRAEPMPENPWYYANGYLRYYSLPPYHGYWNYGSQFARLKRY